jgi:hypothetical protein
MVIMFLVYSMATPSPHLPTLEPICDPLDIRMFVQHKRTKSVAGHAPHVIYSCAISIAILLSYLDRYYPADLKQCLAGIIVTYEYAHNVSAPFIVEVVIVIFSLEPC